MTDEENWFNGTTQRDPNEKPLVIEIRAGQAWKTIGAKAMRCASDLASSSI